MYLTLIPWADGGLIDRGQGCVRTTSNGRWWLMIGCVCARVYGARGSVDAVRTVLGWC
ncbi:hypothetical protein ES288_A06G139000v1 [Gossypium darwinii]|uniref:Uncharacterized protein n=1 Tax=Gossypium darwinii TaxID=34276 RepID=A0A5D2G5W4_GOSDA|nr:hypothetical protein ES288_A06G139000v1 [Gossypium darwinii]